MVSYGHWDRQGLIYLAAAYLPARRAATLDSVWAVKE